MRSRTVFNRPALRWLLIAVGTLLLLKAVIPSAIPDPKYKGRSLSGYLLRAFNARGNSAELRARQSEAREALRSIGTNACPLLRDWIVAPESKWRAKVREVFAQRKWPIPLWAVGERRSLALWAVREFPEVGEPLIPMFVDWMKSSSNSFRYTGTVLLTEVLPTAREPIRREIAESLLPKVPALLVDTVEPYLQLRLAEQLITNAMPLPKSVREKLADRILATEPTQHVRSLQLNQLADRLGIDSEFRLHYLTNQPRSNQAIVSAVHFAHRAVLPEKIIPILQGGLESTNTYLVLDVIEGFVPYRSAALSGAHSLSNLTLDPRREVADKAKSVLNLIRHMAGEPSIPTRHF